MLREKITESLKEGMRAKDQRTVSTVRLIVAALKDRDIASRGKGRSEGIDDTEILQMLQTMIKQRQESISHYEKGGRLELAEQEREEIDVINRFLPEQLSGDEMGRVITNVIDEIGAEGLKDMGRTMGVLKERYAGQMDFGKASAIVKTQLS